VDKNFFVMQYLKANLFMNEIDILKFAATAPHRYKSYPIPKKNGKGVRDISHPSSELKYIQTILNKKFDEFFSIHECAIAYRKGKSIKDNAILHANNSYLLKLDLENFFPSIDDELMTTMLENNGIILSDQDLNLLLNLVLIKPKRKRKKVLTIGAPTSPILSNFIMFVFDNEMQLFCQGKNVIYSRYADDLSFSAMDKKDLSEIEIFAKYLFKVHYFSKFKINNQKTVFTHKGNNRLVTGIKINEDNQITLGRDQKRYLYACVHNILIKNKKVDLEYIESLIGKINYFIFIQPSFEEELNRKYQIHVIDMLKNIARDFRH